MIDLEGLWRQAGADMKVCTTTGSTKNMVLAAITNGARDYQAVAAAVPLCGDNGCSSHNPSGRGCHENVAALLAVYVPIYEMMTEGGGCRHHKKA